jgi:hypothetical protein
MSIAYRNFMLYNPILVERESTIPLIHFTEDSTTIQVDVSKATDTYLQFLIFSLGTSDSYFDVRYKIRGKEFILYPEKLIEEESPEEDYLRVYDHVQELNKADYIEIEKVEARPQRMIPGVEYYVNY